MAWITVPFCGGGGVVVEGVVGDGMKMPKWARWEGELRVVMR